MSRFIIGQIRADVNRGEGDLYTVRLTHPEDPEIWIENRNKSHRPYRTALSDLELAALAIAHLKKAVEDPDRWQADLMLKVGHVSPQEVEATIEMAERLAPYFDDAMLDVANRMEVFSEHFEKGVESYNPELGIARILQLPEHIGSKEDIANFFAYLVIVDRTSYHPDDNFDEYVGPGGDRAFSVSEAAERNALMVEAFQAAEVEGVDLYEIGVWVNALTGSFNDPNDDENAKDAPKWLKQLSKTWV